MVKYQFTSQDAQQWTNQLERLQEIIEKQARIIEKLENENNDLRLQVEKLSLQLGKKQGKSENYSDLLEIQDGKQDQDGCIIQQQQIEKIFTQNSTSLFPIHYEKTIHPQSTNIFNQQLFKLTNIKEVSDKSSQNQQQQDQSKVNDQSSREQKQSQSNGSSNNSSLIQNNIQQNHNKSNPFAVDDSTQSVVECKSDYNIFGQSKKNDLLQKQSNFLQINYPPENQKEEIILEVEEEEEEALMFGDPSSIFYNNTLADKSKINKAQDVEQLIKDLQISENQKENSQQNINDASSQSNDSAELNQNGEDFQFEEYTEESISN